MAYQAKYENGGWNLYKNGKLVGRHKDERKEANAVERDSRTVSESPARRETLATRICPA